MNHAEQAFLKPPVAEPPKKSLKDATLEDLSLEKQAAVTGGLSDKQKDALMARAAENNETARITDLSDREKDAIVKRLAEQNRAGLYAEASSHDVTDAYFDSLSDDEKLAMFDKAEADAKSRAEASSVPHEEQTLKQVDRANEILELDPKVLEFARNTIRTYREKIVTAEADAQKSFERIQQLQAKHTKALEVNSPDAGQLDADLTAEIKNKQALEEAIERHKNFVSMATAAFEKKFNIPAGSTVKE